MIELCEVVARKMFSKVQTIDIVVIFKRVVSQLSPSHPNPSSLPVLDGFAYWYILVTAKSTF